jgi:hypothetical protein
VRYDAGPTDRSRMTEGRWSADDQRRLVVEYEDGRHTMIDIIDIAPDELKVRIREG